LEYLLPYDVGFYVHFSSHIGPQLRELKNPTALLHFLKELFALPLALIRVMLHHITDYFSQKEVWAWQMA